MFDRFISLARAKKALHEERYLDALQQASAPLIREHRRAGQIRLEATQQLIRRARTCLEAGDTVTALAQAERLQQLSDGEAVTELVRVATEAASFAQIAQGELQAVCNEFRRLVDAGDLSGAESLLVSTVLSDGDRERMTNLVAVRRKEAIATLDRAIVAASEVRFGRAIDGYLQATSIDTRISSSALSAALREIAVAVVDHLEAGVKVGSANHAQLIAMLDGYAQTVVRLPALAADSAVERFHGQLEEAVSRCLNHAGSLADAAELARAVRSSGIPRGPDLDQVIAALLTLFDSEHRQPRLQAAVLTQLRAYATQAGLLALAELAADGVAAAAHGEERVEVARALLEEGNLEAARTMFVAFLSDNPLHEAVQKELELLDESMADLDRRLADVRTSLRSGRLREACTGAMALVGTARITAESQQILVEARGRMAVVEKGLDEIRVLLCGRAAASQAGVRNCLKRLEELGKVQVDHVELPKIIEAVSAELEALELCVKAIAALAVSDFGEVLKSTRLLVDARQKLLSVERIDAKLCQLGDGVRQCGDRAQAEGRLSVMLRCASILEQLEPVRDDFAVGARAWHRDHQQRELEVAELLREARLRLVDRDVADAERLVEEAQAKWQESAEVRAFSHQLQKLRKQGHTLDEVSSMAADRDFLGAHQKLAAMPDVPPLLRTRVFDIKQDLARAQGLEGPFLMRVDEGGEQLVMRGESFSIGNLRHAKADLPLLANLAGRHATIHRSMSFHGGMQDSIVAEEGEVQVGAQQVRKHVLQSGDKVQLGPALRVLYQKPTTRSLTSRLLLQGGFQVAGTDRILLMKDRGRDGRILIGPGNDAHVPVAKATGEVEIFSNTSGQMRVFSEQGGSIDGTVFKGEHPVAAGQIIEACGITLILMPWQSIP